MSRRFLAVVPEGLTENSELNQLLSKLKRTTRERGQDVRWVPPDLWHVTLAFLGEGPGDVISALKDWHPEMTDIHLRLHGLGAFPSAEDARVLWLGCQASQEFLRLRGELVEQLSKFGLSIAEREFNPHLTLGRFRNPFGASSLLGLGGRKHFGDYRPRELILFESVLQGNILKYSPVWRHPLT